MADEVLIENDGGVRIITLNRPDRLNALTGSIMEPLADACADAARDPSVGCVVVTGAGRGFCAGGDLKGDGGGKGVVPANPETGSRTEQGFARLRGYMETARLLHEMGKPTIAMVNGPVAGAGIGIAGACDLRFAGRAASFLTAFTSRQSHHIPFVIDSVNIFFRTTDHYRVANSFIFTCGGGAVKQHT